jgi:hypothetical protein
MVAYREHHQRWFLMPAPVTMHVNWKRDMARLGKLMMKISTTNPNFWDIGMGLLPSRIEIDTKIIARRIASAA